MTDLIHVIQPIMNGLMDGVSVAAPLSVKEIVADDGIE